MKAEKATFNTLKNTLLSAPNSQRTNEDFFKILLSSGKATLLQIAKDNKDEELKSVALCKCHEIFRRRSVMAAAEQGPTPIDFRWMVQRLCEEQNGDADIQFHGGGHRRRR